MVEVFEAATPILAAGTWFDLYRDLSVEENIDCFARLSSVSEQQQLVERTRWDLET